MRLIGVATVALFKFQRPCRRDESRIRQAYTSAAGGGIEVFMVVSVDTSEYVHPLRDSRITLIHCEALWRFGDATEHRQDEVEWLIYQLGMCRIVRIRCLGR